jgi:UrcA family protein
MKTRLITTGCAVAVLLLGAAHAAGLSGTTSTQTLPVRFSAAALDRPATARAVYGRIRAAAHRVCAARDGEGIASHMRYETCARRAIGAAVASVDHPRLTELYFAHEGAGSRTGDRKALASR